MSERMSDERLAEMRHVWFGPDEVDELLSALKAERKTLESLPCYMAWFWNDGEPDPFPDCDCPVCEMKAKPDEC